MPAERQSSRYRLLSKKMRNKKFRDSYVGANVRLFLAQQFRALRGEMSQEDFGKLIGKPQSVVSRLEDTTYGKYTLQTLLDVAAKLNRAVIVRVVDFPTFLRFTEDMSESSVCPAGYDSDLLEQSFLDVYRRSASASFDDLVWENVNVSRPILTEDDDAVSNRIAAAHDSVSRTLH